MHWLTKTNTEMLEDKTGVRAEQHKVKNMRKKRVETKVTKIK